MRNIMLFIDDTAGAEVLAKKALKLPVNARQTCSFAVWWRI